MDLNGQLEGRVLEDCHTYNYGKSPLLIGKSTINGPFIFHSYVTNYQRVVPCAFAGALRFFPRADLSQKKKVEEEPECVNLEVWLWERDGLADCFTWIFHENSWDTTQWDI